MSEPRKMSPVFEGESGKPPKKKSRHWVPMLALIGFGGCIVLVAVAVGVIGPILSQMRSDRSRFGCQNNLRALSRASLLYATDNDDCLPLPESWPAGIERYTGRRMESALRCPAFGRRSNHYGLAMSVELTGQKVAAVQNAGQTMLIFDTTDLRRGTAAKPDTLPKPGRHQVRSYGNNAAFADGSVQFIPDPK